MKIFWPRGGVNLAGAILVLAVFAVYCHSFAGPFIFDDEASITENPTIRHLWPLGPVLSPPHENGITVGGRPMLNFSFAVNYALGGTSVRGYHVLNLAIHALAGLTLFGIVRRTLRLCSGPALLQPVLRGRFGASATPLALVVALLWAVHPLQTESVTYVVQRAESLMGLFYLLTLYCFIRGTESPAPVVTHFAFSGVGGALVAPRCEASSQPTMWANCVNTPAPGRWQMLAIAACLLGMATKEVMVSAPLMVLLYDRTFVAGSFREAWRRRARLYAGLTGTWLLLGYLVAGAGNRGGSAGFGRGIPWWAHALTQFQTVVRYLWLAVWPHPLALDYTTKWVQHAAEVAPYALILVPLVAGTLVALKRQPALGFAGAWFFAILAPTSSVVPVEMMCEYRMYLPLAAVVALLVMGMYTLGGWRSLPICLVLAAGLGVLTAQRNKDYRSTLAIWSDTVEKCPGGIRGHLNLGIALVQAGRVTEGIAHFEQALRLKPHYAEVHNNFGVALAQAGRMPESIAHLEQAVRLKPDYAEAHYNLGIALIRAGRIPEAISHFEQALRLKPDYTDARNNLLRLRAFLQTSGPKH